MCLLRYVNFMKCIDEHGINLYCLSEKCQSQFESSYETRDGLDYIYYMKIMTK